MLTSFQLAANCGTVIFWTIAVISQSHWIQSKSVDTLVFLSPPALFLGFFSRIEKKWKTCQFECSWRNPDHQFTNVLMFFFLSQENLIFEGWPAALIPFIFPVLTDNENVQDFQGCQTHFGQHSNLKASFCFIGCNHKTIYISEKFSCEIPSVESRFCLDSNQNLATIQRVFG